MLLDSSCSSPFNNEPVFVLYAAKVCYEIVVVRLLIALKLILTLIKPPNILKYAEMFLLSTIIINAITFQHCL